MQNRLTKQQIFERDKGKCWLCGQLIDLTLQAPHPLSLTIDHIVPKNKGGTSSSKNKACSHAVCNFTKSNTMPCKWMTGVEGILFSNDEQTAVLLMVPNEDLLYLINKLLRTRRPWLKKIINNIYEELNDRKEIET